ncbi:DJ-1/PfpI family protein [Treponema sp.]|uniref:DJ-1/PfpI family protein n=1 Tax=Treponema sp. TaxID=166 RepID=UPI003F017131
MLKINILLFEDFETLDIFGPVEILARVEGHELFYHSLDGGIVKSAQGTQIVTSRLENPEPDSVLVIPGGRGTRKLVNDERFLKCISQFAQNARYVLSICTGSALLAKAGVINGLKATSNKKAFDWVMSVSSQVKWIQHARWIKDGKFYTSSGVSAGMDMALGFICDLYGTEKAEKIAQDIEYIWNRDNRIDPFA